MRSFFVTLMAGLLLAGCGAELRSGTTSDPTASPTPTPDPESWVMGPDSFGPISTATTRKQALATGLYRAAPSPCSAQRLDWRGQKYKDIPGTDDKDLAKPYLPTISYDNEGSPEFIDPGPGTATDRGIRKADSLSRLQITYDDDLIPGLDQSPGRGSFAVSGDRSHLLFVVMYGKVVGFFIAAGHVEEPEDVMTVAGALKKQDSIRPGRGRLC